MRRKKEMETIHVIFGVSYKKAGDFPQLYIDFCTMS